MPYKKIGKNPKGTPYIGIELELENKDVTGGYITSDYFYDRTTSFRKRMLEIFPEQFANAYNTGDDGGGVEFRLPPCSYATWIKLKDSMKKFFKLCKDREFFVDKTAGIHIHLDKSAFTYPIVSKLLKFVTINKELTEYVADRPNNHEYKSQRRIGNYNESSLDFAFRNGPLGSISHYSDDNRFINIQTRTIEFRMFNSTLDVDKFYVNLQFIYGLWDFFKQIEKSDNTPNLEDYLDYVKKMQDVMPELFQYLNKKYKIKTTHVITNVRRKTRPVRSKQVCKA